VHIAEVEIDPATGHMTIPAYTAVDDCGRALDHMIVEGQLHGSVAAGLGQALMENTVYDSGSGQLVTGSFMDYAMPRRRHAAAARRHVQCAGDHQSARRQRRRRSGNDGGDLGGDGMPWRTPFPAAAARISTCRPRRPPVGGLPAGEELTSRFRHPEVAAKRPSKDAAEGAGAVTLRCSALRAEHLRVTNQTRR